MTDDDLYQRLGQLIAEIPILGGDESITPEINRWLGRAIALAEKDCSRADMMSMKMAAQMLDGVNRQHNAQTISIVLFQAFAKAELRASQAMQGAFLPAASPYEAFMQVGKVLSAAESDVLIVDPYAEMKLLDEFARQVTETVRVRVMADAGSLKPSLVPAAARWQAQFNSSRPLEVRSSQAKSFHDRLIIIDKKVGWSLGQSFNQLAERAPTTIVKLPPKIGDLKILAMEALWLTATPLL